MSEAFVDRAQRIWTLLDQHTINEVADMEGISRSLVEEYAAIGRLVDDIAASFQRKGNDDNIAVLERTIEHLTSVLKKNEATYQRAIEQLADQLYHRLANAQQYQRHMQDEIAFLRRQLEHKDELLLTLLNELIQRR